MSYDHPLNVYDDELLCGYSRSGIATYVKHKPSKLIFDLGHCPVTLSANDNVLLTHTHLDHAGGVVQYLQYRGLAGMRNEASICLPRASFIAMCSLVESMDSMDNQPGVHSKAKFVPLDPGTNFRLDKQFEVQTFAVDHVAPSLGYRILRHGTRLKGAYKNHTPNDLKLLREQGVEIGEPAITGSFVFIGDSTPKPFEDDPSLWHADTVVMEATYIHSHPNANRYGHTELPRLMASLRAVPLEKRPKRVYLKHFSTRYSYEEIHAAINALVAEGLPVIAMIPKAPQVIV